jgi:glycosyltransferase involved in cell wall biosynthesis
MDIGVVSERFYPDSLAVAVRLRHLVQALAALPGARVTLYTASRGVATQGCRVVRTWSPPVSNELPYLLRLVAEAMLGVELALRLLLSRRRLWVITSPPFVAAWLCSLACVLRRAPYVLDVRDSYPQVFFVVGVVRPDSRTGRWLDRLEASLYRRAALLAVATQGLAEHVRRRCGEAGKVVLLTNGFDADLFQVAPVKYPTFTAVFHGNLGRFQRPDLIVRLARRCHDAGLAIRFLVIGWGSNRDEFDEQVPGNLEFRGRVPYEQIPAIIGQAHVGLSFRTDDEVSRASFPVKVYEYLGVGIPVLVTPRSEGGEFVESHQIGYQFAPDDEEAIFGRLVWLYHHTDDLQALAGRCQALRHRFSRAFLAQQFAATLAERLTPR